MPNLTNSFIDSIEAPKAGYVLYWDDKLKGFGIKVLSSGRRLFVLQYRTKSRISRRYTIGAYGALTPQIARKQAMLLLTEIAYGKDPMEEKRRCITAETMKDLCEQYMEKHAKMKKKKRSQELDQYLIDRFILPEFGSQKVADIDRSLINQLHYKMRKTHVQANHVLQVLSKMFNLAEKWGLRPDYSNPVRHVEKYPVQKRERFLSMEELTCLSQVLRDAIVTGTESAPIVAAYRLLIFTGCRLSEIQTLKWEYVDFENSCLRLPDSKTGKKNVQLGAPALEVLATLPRQPNNPYVIYGIIPGKHISDLQGPWQRIRKTAGIEDVRIHDLRHTFASVAVGMGETLPMIGKLLGHTQMQTTQRYAHLAVTPQKAAADRIAGTIAGMMTGGSAQILQIHANNS